MDSDLYLIADVERGEPALDIASRIECGVCRNDSYDLCVACESTGFFWLIPTSGHRAYPFWYSEMSNILLESLGPVLDCIPEPPSSWPDHYHATSAPKGAGISGLVEALGLKPKPMQLRRI